MDQDKDQERYSNSVSPASVSGVTDLRKSEEKEILNKINSATGHNSPFTDDNIKTEFIESLTHHSSRTSSPQQNNSSLNDLQIKPENFLNSDFFSNFNKAAALNAANNYAAALMAQQQSQMPSDFASFFGGMAAMAAAVSNPLDSVSDKTFSSMLASAGLFIILTAIILCNKFFLFY